MKSAYSVLFLASLLGAATCLFQQNYIFMHAYMSWADAQTYCRTYYLDLISFHSEEDIQVFLTYYGNSYIGQYWIGLSKSPNALRFTQWSDGTPVLFTSWNEGEPSDLDFNDCVTIDVISGNWSTFNCTLQLDFFCYTWYPQTFVVQDLKTWDEALTHCRTVYTDLISLPTETDFFAVNWYLSNHTTSVWTGLRFMDGLWFWVDSDPLGNLVNQSSCPAPPYHCGALVPGTDTLENRDCMEKMNFVCYFL